jgi:hypothetical protein
VVVKIVLEDTEPNQNLKKRVHCRLPPKFRRWFPPFVS